jgi:long-chain acyl-CoA synthetase
LVRDLDALSNRVANGLAAGGVKPGHRVTLFGPDSWEWLVSYYGIVKTGAVVNPINSHLKRCTVTDSGARAVIASPDKGENLLAIKGAANLAEVVLWADAPVTGATLLSDWLHHGKPEFFYHQRKSSGRTVICYTSGTTGLPKGAMRSQAPSLAPP